MTAQEIIEAACVEIDFLQPGDSLSAVYSGWVLGKFNRFLATLSTDGIIIHARIYEDFSLVSNTAAYTIGTGKDFNTVQPKVIENAFIKDSSGHDHPLSIRPIREYWTISEKSTKGRPFRLYYDPNGIIYFYYTPDSAYAFHMISLKPFTVCATLDAEVDLPGEYENFLILNMAVQLASGLGKELDESLVYNAKIAFESVRSRNLADQMKSVELNISGIDSSYNINTG